MILKRETKKTFTKINFKYTKNGLFNYLFCPYLKKKLVFCKLMKKFSR